ncbi:MAG: transposase [Ktedonobacterales bacterium]
MMGAKARQFRPVPAVSLDELVPADHFYRHLERVLDLSFLRDLVQDCYAAGMGRPSVDPVVFFRLQLVMFFEGIRSERQLLRLAADRLSVRWYLGYNLDEPLPDHSSLTRIRLRYGLEVFRRFFEAEELTAANAARHDWIAEEGRQQREVRGVYQRTADLRISTTDPDATPMRLKGVMLPEN